MEPRATVTTRGSIIAKPLWSHFFVQEQERDDDDEDNVMILFFITKKKVSVVKLSNTGLNFKNRAQTRCIIRRHCCLILSLFFFRLFN